MPAKLSLPAVGATLLLAGCSEEPTPPPPPEPKPRLEAPAQARPTVPEPAPPSAAPADGAADLLRHYYSLIEQRRYEEAHALRDAGGADAAAFAAHFGRFEAHQVTIGTPSEPVQAGDWLYVEVPVQSYGTTKDGRPIASAGTVTLRRRARAGAWRIFTKG